MPVYTRQDLSIMQAWPLERKIRVTQAKILEWYHHYGGRMPFPFRAERILPCFWIWCGGHFRTFRLCL